MSLNAEEVTSSEEVTNDDNPKLADKEEKQYRLQSKPFLLFLSSSVEFLWRAPFLCPYGNCILAVSFVSLCSGLTSIVSD